MWNIIGEQGPKDPAVRVLLVAHWDTRPAAELESDPADKLKGVPGANDGASGVSVLLELAHVLQGHLPDGVAIEYLMTDGQSLGPGTNEMFLGAEAFAKDVSNHPKPTYGILVDMVGQKNLTIQLELNSIQSAKTLLYALWRHAAQVGLGDVFPMEFGQKLMDDHLPLNRVGIRTIDLIDFHYLPFWHTLQDTPDKCSAESLGKVGKLLQTWLQKDPIFTYEGG
jgi:Zn-dependent M28 family amino/carboxypeptidase